MHHGAGVGLRKTELGPRLLPNSISGSDPSLIFSGFDQSPAASRCRFPAFLPGSGQKVEVVENTRLNPVYPVLELHICHLGTPRSFANLPSSPAFKTQRGYVNV
jgi:hypothetical protein